MEESQTETEQNHSSPNKRLKTNHSPNGKSILQETETETNRCGICLSETIIGSRNGVTRGFIDSCDHYFCFVCIMEWSKVESKCPLCKRRFSEITRPIKLPLFASQRVVRVPVRDQVYCNSGNATVGPPNLYSDVTCSVCNSVGEKPLLLLCDLCDSASHTHCVGLGATLPEGDWFCHDCTLLKHENQESEPNVGSCPQVRYPSGRNLSSVNENISISDIVQEPNNSAVIRTSRSTGESTVTNNVSSQSSTRPEILEILPAQSSVRTLQGRHNAHDRIRRFRENWGGYQTGRYHFNNNQGVNSITTSRVTASAENRRNPVSRAWKMFEKAKSSKTYTKRSMNHAS